MKFWMLNPNHVFGMVGGEVRILGLLDMYDNRCKDQKGKIKSMNVGKILWSVSVFFFTRGNQFSQFTPITLGRINSRHTRADAETLVNRPTDGSVCRAFSASSFSFTIWRAYKTTKRNNKKTKTRFGKIIWDYSEFWVKGQMGPSE